MEEKKAKTFEEHLVTLEVEALNDLVMPTTTTSTSIPQRSEVFQVQPSWVASTRLMLAVLKEQSVKKDVSSKRSFDMISEELLRMAKIADMFVSEHPYS